MAFLVGYVIAAALLDGGCDVGARMTALLYLRCELTQVVVSSTTRYCSFTLGATGNGLWKLFQDNAVFLQLIPGVFLYMLSYTVFVTFILGALLYRLL